MNRICYFTFAIFEKKEISQLVPIILPHTYEDGLKYLDGAKRYKLGEKKRKNI